MILNIVPSKPVKKLYESSGPAHTGDVGLDIFCPKDLTIQASTLGVKIDLGIRCEAYTDQYTPTGFYLYPRSSMGLKTPLRLSNSVGIIDPGYRGKLAAIVDNMGLTNFEIKAGDSFFQIVAPDMSPIHLSFQTKLTPSSRGENGFGSTLDMFKR